ncbi:MAG: hypothetical protein ACT4O1_05000 [Gemmatimonadota bacterium]
MRRTAVLGMLLLVMGVAKAHAQLPIQLSANAGLAVPIRNEGDLYDNGLHLGVGLKVALIPVQIEAAYDRMGASNDNNEDLGVVSGGVSLPLPVTPPLLPVGLYLIVGGGVYRTSAEVTSTDFGANGGLGVRVGVPGLSLFGEGRGIVVWGEGNKVTYLTASVGVRF